VNDIVVGIKLVGDAKGFTGEVRLSRQELQGLNRDTEEGRKAAEAGRKATEDLAKSMRQLSENFGTARTATGKHTETLKGAAGAADKASESQASLSAEVFKGAGASRFFAAPGTRRSRSTTRWSRPRAPRRNRMRASMRFFARPTARPDRRRRRSRSSPTRWRASRSSTTPRSAMPPRSWRRSIVSAAAAFERILKLSADLASTGRGDLETWVTVLAKFGSEPAEAVGLFERAFGKLDPVLKVQIRNLSEMGDKQAALASAWTP
jgi:hypothetical protein